MKRFLPIVLLLLLLSFISCKEEPQCEGWPSGFACYETTDGSKKDYCTVPLLKGWNFLSQSFVAAYALEMTIQQGFHHLYLGSPEDGFFVVGDNYNLDDGRVKNSPLSFNIEVDQQWVNHSSGLYWFVTEGSLTITAADEEKGTVSLEASYTLATAENGGDARSFIVELHDYPFTFNPR